MNLLNFCPGDEEFWLLYLIKCCVSFFLTMWEASKNWNPTAIPFPHRGNVYIMCEGVSWDEQVVSKQRINWLRNLHRHQYMLETFTEYIILREPLSLGPMVRENPFKSLLYIKSIVQTPLSVSQKKYSASCS